MTAPGSSARFYAAFAVIGGSYAALIVALLIADYGYTSNERLWAALQSPEIRYAIKLSLVSCTVTTLLSLWVGVPLGFLLSRVRFPGKAVLDTLLDIPIVLPPLVIGLSLLILMQTQAGKYVEDMTYTRMGKLLLYGLIPWSRPSGSGRWSEPDPAARSAHRIRRRGRRVDRRLWLTNRSPTGRRGCIPGSRRGSPTRCPASSWPSSRSAVRLRSGPCA